MDLTELGCIEATGLYERQRPSSQDGFDARGPAGQARLRRLDNLLRCLVVQIAQASW